ncbi:MAG: hypothetical protein OEL50_01700 [Rhodospirillaceae bacterium]|nr:hypothetical protein [Rhodospirillaceae bacterium]
MAAKIKENVLSARFQPVILHGQSTINTFRVIPVLSTIDDSVHLGNKVIPYSGDPVKTAKLNASILDIAFSELAMASEEGKKLRLIVPINSYSVVGSEGATLIVTAIKKLPKELRNSVIVELFDFPENVTMNVLEDDIVPLFPFFENYIAAPADEMDDFTIFANCNFLGVSMDLSELDQGAEDTGKKIVKFWASATKRRLKLFFQGVADEGVKQTAERYEAMGIDGPIIGEMVETL